MPEKEISLIVFEDKADRNFLQECAHAMSQFLIDKIFSEDVDDIGVGNSNRHFEDVEFNTTDWKAVERILQFSNFLTDKGTLAQDSSKNLASVVSEAFACLRKETRLKYQSRKLVYFTQFDTVIEKDEIEKLQTILNEKRNIINIIIPSVPESEDLIIEKSKLKPLLSQNDNISLIPINELKFLACNKVTQKVVKPHPWNVEFEVGPDIKIEVSGYRCIKKNDPVQFNKALAKVTGFGNLVSDNPSNEDVVPYTSTVSKEIQWKENDGTAVEETDVGKAYFFGDKLIPFTEIEHQESYHSGPKCLKLLFCTPKERIHPSFLIGDGTTEFFPKAGDLAALIKFRALAKALHDSDRVAVAKKIYRQDTRVQLGVLIPHPKKFTLSFAELSYGDDLHVPNFPLLCETAEEDIIMSKPINQKESCIDALINSKTIEFDPMSGPVDTSQKKIRDNVASKILRNDLEIDKTCNILKFFEKKVSSGQLSLKEGISETFSLVTLKENEERPSGGNIFRKRERIEEETWQLSNTTKVIKMSEDEKLQDIKNDENCNYNDDIDALIDDL